MNKYTKSFNSVLLIGDLQILNISFLIAYLFKFGQVRSAFEAPYLYLLIFFNIAWLVVTVIKNPYKISRTSRFAEIIRAHFTIILLHLFFITAFWVFNKAYFYSRVHLATTYSIFVTLMFFWRVIFIYTLRIYRAKGFNKRNVIIAGYGELGDELLKFFRLHPEHGFKFCGYFDDSYTGPNSKGKISSIKQFANNNDIHEIYCCLPYVNYKIIQDLISFGENKLIKVKLIADFRGFPFKAVELQHYDHIPVLNVSAVPLDEWKNRFIKRSFDILFSSIVITFFLSWLIPIVSVLIKIDSRGSVFFKQKRTGKNNKSFWCWKFRTMRINDNSDEIQAIKNDSRITKLGSLLRSTSIDELPQFFNVLSGSMSVVGPRPHMLKHTKQYAKIVEKFMARHFVKPGITGLAQAKGYRGETKSVTQMKNRVKLDRFYIENWSISLDIKIIALTMITLTRKTENAF